MSVSIKTSLSTKKADKLLSKELKDYIMQLGNNKKSLAALQLSYSLTKQNPAMPADEVVEQIEERFRVVDSYYKPENDKCEKYLLYSIMFENVGKVSPEIMKRYADIQYFANYPRYTNMLMFYMQYYLITYGISDADMRLLIEDTCEIVKINRNNYSCDSVYTIFFQHRLYDNPHVKDDFVRLINSPLIREILLQKEHVSKDTFLRDEKNIVELCEKSHLQDFEKDENGYFIIVNKFANYYAKPAMKFIAKQPGRKKKSWTYFDSDAKYYYLPYITEHITFDSIPSAQIRINVAEKSTSLEILKSASTKTYINEYEERIFYQGSISAAYKFYAYDKENIYVNVSSSKARPALLGDLVNAARTCEKAYDIILGWIDYMSADTPFFRDFRQVFVESVEAKFPLLPLSVKDIFVYHNWMEYFTAKYKPAKKMNINFNKLKPHAAYALIKCSSYIASADIQIFADFVRKHPEEAVCRGYKKDRVVNYLTNFYRNKLSLPKQTNSTTGYILRTWIKMMMDAKKKISLRRKSLNKMSKEHIRFIRTGKL